MAIISGRCQVFAALPTTIIASLLVHSSAEKKSQSISNYSQAKSLYYGSNSVKPGCCIRARTRNGTHLGTYQRTACRLRYSLLRLHRPPKESHCSLSGARSYLFSNLYHDISTGIEPNSRRPPCQQLKDQSHGDHILGRYVRSQTTRDEC